MNIKKHDGDPVQEAINRAEWVDYLGFAEVDGHDILVEAHLSEGGTPTLTIYAGGEFDEAVGEYAGETVYTETFDRVWHLDRAVGQCHREHELERIGGYDDGE
jgi:hypothetical protein